MTENVTVAAANIGATVRKLVLENPTMKNDDILKMVKDQFPNGKTSYACIAWYKTDMRKKGLIASKKSRDVETVTKELQEAYELVKKLEAEHLELVEPTPEEEKVEEEKTEEAPQEETQE